MYVHTHTYMHTYMHTYTYTCYICMYPAGMSAVHICSYIHAYIHTYMYICRYSAGMAAVDRDLAIRAKVVNLLVKYFQPPLVKSLHAKGMTKGTEELLGLGKLIDVRHLCVCVCVCVCVCMHIYDTRKDDEGHRGAPRAGKAY
jgi:hypothetical protein